MLKMYGIRIDIKKYLGLKKYSKQNQTVMTKFPDMI